jgi:hypothetical protein
MRVVFRGTAAICLVLVRTSAHAVSTEAAGVDRYGGAQLGSSATETPCRSLKCPVTRHRTERQFKTHLADVKWRTDDGHH